MEHVIILKPLPCQALFEHLDIIMNIYTNLEQLLKICCHSSLLDCIFAPHLVIKWINPDFERNIFQNFKDFFMEDFLHSAGSPIKWLNYSTKQHRKILLWWITLVMYTQFRDCSSIFNIYMLVGHFEIHNLFTFSPKDCKEMLIIRSPDHCRNSNIAILAT